MAEWSIASVCKTVARKGYLGSNPNPGTFMETLIIPGYSLKNKDWAESLKNSFDPIYPTKINYYPHWQVPEVDKNWLNKEVEKIVKGFSNQKINILAKSVGSIIAMKVLALNPDMFNKIILCGIPFEDFLPGDNKLYEALKSLPIERILIVQNENDNHGSFLKVENLIHQINPEIKVISMPRDDHEYPYPNEFLSFFSS